MGGDQSLLNPIARERQDTQLTSQIIAHCMEQQRLSDKPGTHSVYLSHAKYDVRRAKAIADAVERQCRAEDGLYLRVEVTPVVSKPLRVGTHLCCMLTVRWPGRTLIDHSVRNS